MEYEQIIKKRATRAETTLPIGAAVRGQYGAGWIVMPLENDDKE